MAELPDKELAFQKILDIAERYKDKQDGIQKANEANTRLLIIDEVLKSLGWNPDEFNPETHTSSNGCTFCINEK